MDSLEALDMKELKALARKLGLATSDIRKALLIERLKKAMEPSDTRHRRVSALKAPKAPKAAAPKPGKKPAPRTAASKVKAATKKPKKPPVKPRQGFESMDMPGLKAAALALGLRLTGRPKKAEVIAALKRAKRSEAARMKRLSVKKSEKAAEPKVQKATALWQQPEPPVKTWEPVVPMAASPAPPSAPSAPYHPTQAGFAAPYIMGSVPPSAPVIVITYPAPAQPAPGWGEPRGNLGVIAVEPGRAMVTWEIPSSVVLRGPLGVMVREKRVNGSKGFNAGAHIMDVPVPLSFGGMFLDLLPGRSYSVQIGVRTAKGRFEALTKKAVVKTPPGKAPKPLKGRALTNEQYDLPPGLVTSY